MADGLRVRRERPETTEVARTVRREVAWRAEEVVGGERVDARGANDATGAAVMARKAMKMVKRMTTTMRRNSTNLSVSCSH